MNKQKHILALVLLLIGVATVNMTGQSGDWKFGFELGWSNSKIQGDREADMTTAIAENQRFNAGFHLSLYGRYHFTDMSGLQVGVAYAQRGGRNDYDGQSYYLFGKQGALTRLTDVVRQESQDILNGYLDVPVVAFARFGKRFEIGGGGYAGLLLSSKSDGEIRVISANNNFETFFVNTDKQYTRDKFSDAPMGSQEVIVLGQRFDEPETIGAYYELDQDPGASLYNRLDFGLLAQVGFYFNESLNLKGRFSYGLSDVTDKASDVAKSSSVATGLQYRDDKDRNLSMQISLGFLF